MKDWQNSDNSMFYEELPANILKHYATIGGLDNCPELSKHIPAIKNGATILEVGAGYGRVIDYLLKKHANCDIYAIERSKQYLKILKSKYAEQITIIETDILKFENNIKFDVILWLWSGISDFNQYEQLLAIKCLLSKLENNGFLTIETFSYKNVPLNSVTEKCQSYIIDEDGYAKGYGYIPTPKEMENNFAQLNCKCWETREYYTDKGRHRILYTLYK